MIHKDLLQDSEYDRRISWFLGMVNPSPSPNSEDWDEEVAARQSAMRLRGFYDGINHHSED